ncbi:hypothetical protein PG984_008520 [Apiospora sp. TS-2023a]
MRKRYFSKELVQLVQKRARHQPLPNDLPAHLSSDSTNSLPEEPETESLCSRCAAWNLIPQLREAPKAPAFVGADYEPHNISVAVDLDAIQQSRDCPLCFLVLECLSDLGPAPQASELGAGQKYRVEIRRSTFAYLRDKSLAEDQRKCGTHVLKFLKSISRLDVMLVATDLEGTPLGYPQLARRSIQSCLDMPASLLEPRPVTGQHVPWWRLDAWLKCCQKDHGPECAPVILGSKRLRLINVQTYCLDDVVSTHEENVKYAALSYVWGDYPQVKLTKSTMEHLYSPSAMLDCERDIPLTIRDGLKACEWIGIPYLWVDALCILQDDAEEKAMLIGAMDQIYGAAVVTLVAAEGANSNAGLPGVRIAEKARTVSDYSRKVVGDWALSTTAEDLLSVQRRAPWSRRGWTFQEKTLSKRLLIFSSTQCFFWCNSGLYQEDMYLEADPSCYDIEICMFKSATDKHLGRSGSPSDPYPLRNYDEAVSAYISRRLT